MLISLYSGTHDSPTAPRSVLPTQVLLYLNARTFSDDGGATASTVLSKLSLPIVMVHEQDPACGGCGFGEIIQNTPDELKQVRLQEAMIWS